ncbi:MAG: FAD-dependent oxidoreductase [Acidobacteria bacterium]|nr:FAD-dependent oxidoreductase [Acidobacteriota bacterium]
MSTEQTLSGPDFSAGIAFDALPEGSPLLGHAGDEAVLLVRLGDRVSAVGATCTHYSGPLAEGLVVDGTVRCPWHHACFDLKTGAALRAPALNAIPVYDVAIEAGLVRVLGKRAEQPAPKRAGDPASLVIVGAGAAGNAAAEALRGAGYAGSLTMIGAEDSVPVDRPNLSKDYLAGKAPEEWIPLRGADFYAEKDIVLRTGTRVTAIDVAGRAVALSDGSAVPFERLLLATGAEPVRLAVPGADLPHVHTLRTLADSRALIARAAGAKRAVVVGASFIGLEVAAALRERGLEVHVVAPGGRPLEKVLGPEVGDFVKALHEEHGVVFHLGRIPQSISAESVKLSDGSVLEAGLVAVGIGVRPVTGLAETSGLTVDKGVLVDERLETSAPGIYAAGDVARWKDARTGERLRVEHWVVAERMGRAAALAMLGERTPFDAVPFFWSAHYDVTISYVGHAEAWDRIDLHGSLAARDATVAYRREGKTLAVATIGRDRTSLEAEAAFERNDVAALAELGLTR